MTEQKPTGAVVEIVEKVDPRSYNPNSDSPGDTVILPNEVRLNGQPVLIADGDDVIVHEMIIGANGENFARVTLTVLARRVVIGTEPRDGQ